MIDKFASTQAVHAGEDKRKPYGALTTPIVQTSTYTFADTAEILDFMQRKEAGETGCATNTGATAIRPRPWPSASWPHWRVASRLCFSPVAWRLCHHLIRPCCPAAIIWSWSVAAITAAQQFALTYLSRWGIETTLVPIDNPRRWLPPSGLPPASYSPRRPQTPTCASWTCARMSEIARQHGIITMLDSTFATPAQPAAHWNYGIDLVMHSASKYLGGHNDLLAGVTRRIRSDLGRRSNRPGACMGTMSNPNDAYLLLRGLKTLDVRVRRQNENGQRVAEFLEGHPAVERVYYPGLPSHPDHEIAQRQMDGLRRRGHL